MCDPLSVEKIPPTGGVNSIGANADLPYICTYHIHDCLRSPPLAQGKDLPQDVRSGIKKEVERWSDITSLHT